MQPNEIINTRIFNASREKLFTAWSNPNYLQQWWGPNGFTNTFHAFGFTPGFIWDFTMHAPNGDNFHNRNQFVEIIANKKIVFNHIEPVHTFTVTATFEDAGENKTRLTFAMNFVQAEECKRVRPFVTSANEENFDRLEKVLETIR